MIDVMPGICWTVAVVWMIAVCVICIVRGKLFVHGRPHVDLVSWQVIVAQFFSVLLAAMPFVMFKFAEDVIGSDARAFYRAVAWPAGIIAVLLIALELALMYAQAHRAMLTQMDESLAR